MRFAEILLHASDKQLLLAFQLSISTLQLLPQSLQMWRNLTNGVAGQVFKLFLDGRNFVLELGDNHA